MSTTPGLLGMIQQVPDEWTADRRDEWLAAFILVLDFTIPVTTVDAGRIEGAIGELCALGFEVKVNRCEEGVYEVVASKSGLSKVTRRPTLAAAIEAAKRTALDYPAN